MLPATCIHLPIYSTISINLPIGMMCDALAEILISARGKNHRDKPPKYQIFACFWSIFWSIHKMDSPISHHDAWWPGNFTKIRGSMMCDRRIGWNSIVLSRLLNGILFTAVKSLLISLEFLFVSLSLLFHHFHHTPRRHFRPGLGWNVQILFRLVILNIFETFKIWPSYSDDASKPLEESRTVWIAQSGGLNSRRSYGKYVCWSSGSL